MDKSRKRPKLLGSVFPSGFKQGGVISRLCVCTTIMENHNNSVMVVKKRRQ